METEQTQYALAKQLKTAHTLSTNYGDLPLDAELQQAIDAALRPILERRLIPLEIDASDDADIPDFQPLITDEQIDELTMPGNPQFVNRRIGLLTLTKNRDELFKIGEEDTRVAFEMLTCTVAAIETARSELEMLVAAKFRLAMALCCITDQDTCTRIFELAHEESWQALEEFGKTIPATITASTEVRGNA